MLQYLALLLTLLAGNFDSSPLRDIIREQQYCTSLDDGYRIFLYPSTSSKRYTNRFITLGYQEYSVTCGPVERNS